MRGSARPVPRPSRRAGRNGRTILMVVDGVQPTETVTPRNTTELAAALAAASGGRRATVISGGGSKLSWGRTPSGVDLVVSTSGLNQVLAHRYGDLTATI